jgi:hypothetical protein
VSKNVSIDDDVHAQLIEVCRRGSMKIGSVTSGVLRHWLSKVTIPGINGISPEEFNRRALETGNTEAIQAAVEGFQRSMDESEKDLKDNPEACLARVQAAAINMDGGNGGR